MTRSTEQNVSADIAKAKKAIVQKEYDRLIRSAAKAPDAENKAKFEKLANDLAKQL